MSVRTWEWCDVHDGPIRTEGVSGWICLGWRGEKRGSCVRGRVLVVDAEPCPNPYCEQHTTMPHGYPPCPPCHGLGAIPVDGEIRSNGVDRWLHIWLKEEH